MVVAEPRKRESLGASEKEPGPAGLQSTWCRAE